MNAHATSAFGALLRRHRQAAGLTQEELAEWARLSARAVIDLERGARLAPRRETVQLLAEALALPPPERSAFEAAARRRAKSLALSEGLAGAEGGSRPDAPLAPVGRHGGFLGALPTGPLVGRERELGRVLAALDEGAEGRARLVLLAGEPGVGKTRLAQEVTLRAGERGFRVLVGRCYEQHASLPFAPFVEALSTALALASPTLRQEASRRFAYLARLLPELQSGPPPQEGEEARIRVLHAVSGFLGALSAEAPLALLLDDLHWADSASLDLLLHLARQTTGQRVLLLGSYRDVEVNRQYPLERALTDLMRERLVEEISLHGLGRDGTAALIGAHFGVDEVSAELTALVHERTEGNPFFTEEVLKALVEQGAIFQSGADWDPKRAQEIEVPRSVRSVVGQRVGRLSAGAQEVLRMASVLGQEWDLEVFLAAVEQPEGAVLDHLEAALAARLLEERRVGQGERYAFVHALIGQALYDEVPRFRLRRLHMRAGETLERLRGGQAEAGAELARHFLAAGERERAIRYSLRAGEHAAALYAHTEAVHHYRAALELLEAAVDANGVARLREKLGEALRQLGHYDAALDALEQAAETWQAGEDLESLARVLVVISMVHHFRGTPRQGISRIQPWVAPIEGRASSSALAALCEALGQLFFSCGEYVEFLTAIERAVAQLRTLDDTRSLVRVTMHHGNALQMLGRVEEALQVTQEAIRLAEVASDDEYLGAALQTKAAIHLWRGEFEVGERSIQRAIDIAARVGDPYWIIIYGYVRDVLHFNLGEWDGVRRDLERILAASRQSGVFPYPLMLLGGLCLYTGEWEAAARYLDEAITLTERSGDLQGLRFAAVPRAELDVLQGNPDAARARLVPLLDRPGLEEHDVTFLLPVLAWAYLELGEVAQADHTVKEAIRRAQGERLRVMLVNGLRVRALILIRQRRPADAERAVQEGLHLAAAMPFPYAEACLLHAYGSLHAERGEPEPARERLAAALAIFRRLGARKDIDRTEQLLATLS